MESASENLCSVIQYYKGPSASNAEVTLPNSLESSVEEDLNSIQNKRKNVIIQPNQVNDNSQENIEGTVNEQSAPKVEENSKAEADVIQNVWKKIQSENKVKSEDVEGSDNFIKKVFKSLKDEEDSESDLKPESKTWKDASESLNSQNNASDNVKLKCEFETKDVKSDKVKNENELSIKKKKRTFSEANVDSESVGASNASAEEVEANEEEFESDEDDDEVGHKPRRRGRCKKNPDIIPPHLSSDMVLGYKILLKFLETPQFSGFHKPFKKSHESEEMKITCLNQIKKKFEENLYNKISEFVNDVREMLVCIYESRNQVSIKKALRLEQVLEQRIAQLPNYLRPQCALVLSPEEDNNSHNKIRISKGGGFVSLLLEKTEKKRYEKNREKRKLLAEERKQLKEEQDKEIEEWEKNVLLKDVEEEIKSMWELPAIGHFIHLCADILNIGEVAQFEVERMLLMPQCCDTLDLLMTALLTNSLIRARLDRTPSMPYSIWGPLVRNRVASWYRMWHRDCKNEQKIFEELGIEPEFWQVMGPDINPLDYYSFHEVSLLRRVWVLKTLCDADFVRKKTVYDNIRAQTLGELNPVYLGLDLQGNRYIQFKQFCGSDIRIYRQSTKIEGDLTPAELIESFEEFESREGPITAEKVFRDIWELPEKEKVKPKKRKQAKSKKQEKSFNANFSMEAVEKKNLRLSAREKKKVYVDSSDSDQSDTDLRTLRDKLLKCEAETLYRPASSKEFISLSVFRLPRESKQATKRSTYSGRRADEGGRNDGASDKPLKAEPEDRKEDAKPSACDDEQPDYLDSKQMQSIQADFEKNFQLDDFNEDEFDLREKINSDPDGSDTNFSIKNLQELNTIFKKDSSPDGSNNVEENPEDKLNSEDSEIRDKENLRKYGIPDHLKPDSSKFYLVVDSVEGLRQLISKFGSHENDLEIITRSTKSKKKSQNNTSCEVRLIEKLQNLLLELEPWEFDLIKSCRTNKEKMYKEYMNFINRPSDFVHPNEAHWMKGDEEPTVTTATTTTTTTATTVTTAESSSGNGEKSSKEGGATTESPESSQQNSVSESFGLRKRTRTTRVQLQPESDVSGEDLDDADDFESDESDDNWVLPTQKKRIRKEPVNRTPRFPRRSSRRTKSSPSEKTESPTNSEEKTRSSSSEKAKKALFWGPRSTDPSEDLNWETNRQKILEQHNSPIKKRSQSGESTNNSHQSENTQKKSFSVIMGPRRVLPPLPGNKKPYLTVAQLKSIEMQARKLQEEGKFRDVQYRVICTNISNSEGKNSGSNTGSEQERERKFPGKVQSYSRKRGEEPAKPGASSAQAGNRIVQPVQRQSAVVATTTTAQVIGYATPIGAANPGAKTDQKPQVHVQFQQAGIRGQKGVSDVTQNRVITALPRAEDSGQWQQKIITSQPGKVIQQPVQTVQTIQTVQTVQAVQAVQTVQNQAQGQGKSQEPIKISPIQQPIQVPADKIVGSFLQTTGTQVQTANANPDGKFIVVDGKNVLKLETVQHLSKEQHVESVLVLKTNVDPITSTSNQEPNPSNQPNIMVVNKTVPVQQTVSATGVPNFLFPTNYIIQEAGQQAQGEKGQQTVKILQQAPTYMIQQRPVANKPMQAQVIKLITSPQIGSNQNVILATVPGQVLQPVTQTVLTPDQQGKQTLRLLKAPVSGSSATGQGKTNSTQSPILVNNFVQFSPGQRLEAPKTLTPVGSSRIVSAAVPSVRVSTGQADGVSPGVQTQAGLGTAVKPGEIVPGVRLAAFPSNARAALQPTSNNPYPRIVLPSTQTVRLVSPIRAQTQTPTSLNQGQPTRVAAASPQQVRFAASQSQTVIQTAHPQVVRQAGTVGAQAVQVVSHPQILQAEPLVNSGGGTVELAQQFQGQNVVSCVDLNSQSVGLPTSMASQPIGFVQSQPVRFITNNNVGVKFISRSPAPVKATMIAGGNQSPVVEVSNVRPGVVCQPVQYQTILQTPGVQPVQGGMKLAEPKDTSAESIENAPVEEEKSAGETTASGPVEEEKSVGEATARGPVVEEKRPFTLDEINSDSEVTLDYITGELILTKRESLDDKDAARSDEEAGEKQKARRGVMK